MTLCVVSMFQTWYPCLLYTSRTTRLQRILRRNKNNVHKSHVITSHRRAEFFIIDGVLVTEVHHLQKVVQLFL